MIFKLSNLLRIAKIIACCVFQPVVSSSVTGMTGLTLQINGDYKNC